MEEKENSEVVHGHFCHFILFGYSFFCCPFLLTFSSSLKTLSLSRLPLSSGVTSTLRRLPRVECSLQGRPLRVSPVSGPPTSLFPSPRVLTLTFYPCKGRLDLNLFNVRDEGIRVTDIVTQMRGSVFFLLDSRK